ncbi:hypothetical protein [endosymbiont GvMRE of Glomus versiforme]|uniref:hypothetical protein n=1 Tax=endosymbiont GvMRE of Glomus versiforme TaxID=2039283 RepID=UPI000EC9915A|nr:hypothetical protein [endosymbiont GvMRE of Glomus versiforme]RHZ35345.1 hypothetical protein GvMRE_IIg82 [endosymbiont GvMRE of Glomus versiforme]
MKDLEFGIKNFKKPFIKREIIAQIIRSINSKKTNYQLRLADGEAEIFFDNLFLVYRVQINPSNVLLCDTFTNKTITNICEKQLQIDDFDEWLKAVAKGAHLEEDLKMLETFLKCILFMADSNAEFFTAFTFVSNCEKIENKLREKPFDPEKISGLLRTMESFFETVKKYSSNLAVYATFKKSFEDLIETAKLSVQKRKPPIIKFIKENKLNKNTSEKLQSIHKICQNNK